MNRNPGMLINMPPPPSDPTTPSEQGPGTPNSTTTSVSALSVVAVKDGTMGHSTRGSQHHTNTLDAERADRISRLAGLERVGTVRASPSGHLLAGGGPQHQYEVNPQVRERSTVGSASATGSVGGKTNAAWASEMDFDADSKMSEDGASSTGGFSDEDKASLVGFGEGAGSTVSGPVSTATARGLAARQSLNSAIAQARYGVPSVGGMPMGGISEISRDTPMPDDMDVDGDVEMPTPVMPAQFGRFDGTGAELAENVLRERIGDTDTRAMYTPPSKQSLGKFGFED